MTTPATKRDGRSRELDYYYRRRERGDHLFRLWANEQTAQRFNALLDGDRSEDVFQRLVDAAWNKEVAT